MLPAHQHLWLISYRHRYCTYLYYYAPILVPRQALWVVEACGLALPICKPRLPVASERAHGAAGRDDPDRVVVGVRHDDLVVGRQRHALRPVEARGFALPVCEAHLPVAGQRADLAAWFP